MNPSMKTYTATKTVKARPMTKGEYHNYRYWEVLPSDEPGYLVEYPDGERNHHDHKGYISWCPKEIFERYNRVSETFLDRIKIEKEDLSANLTTFSAFAQSEGFKSLSPTVQTLMTVQFIPTVQALLTVQFMLMESYESILEAQITTTQATQAS